MFDLEHVLIPEFGLPSALWCRQIEQALISDARSMRSWPDIRVVSNDGTGRLNQFAAVIEALEL
ncbi:hypothetical protein [Mycobacteroides chelonae]|uniref:hypothetical protein n=1 Tax=Mycobacteroides chelonae TaxID=1774 RepID=UPI0008A9B37F|nr:hypothetical protein [Mycobacteroides chelonae]OHU64929.1 hypothetical protein BKG85_04770 [Mycobacteroides chelonae]